MTCSLLSYLSDNIWEGRQRWAEAVEAAAVVKVLAAVTVIRRNILLDLYDERLKIFTYINVFFIFYTFILIYYLNLRINISIFENDLFFFLFNFLIYYFVQNTK